LLRCYASLLVVSLALGSRTASAQPVDDAARAAVRRLAYSGGRAFDAGDYKAAAEDFERAYAVLKVPSIGVWLGRSLEKVGRLVAASERYQEVLLLPLPTLEPAVHRKAQADARAYRDALLARLGYLAIAVVPEMPSGASVRVDGREVPAALLGQELPVDPGMHHVEVRSGARTAARDVVFVEGQHQRVELPLEPESDVGRQGPDAHSDVGVSARTPPPVGRAADVAPPAPPPPALPAAPPPPSVVRPPALPAITHAGTPLRTTGWIAVGVGAAGVAFGGIMGGIALGENANLDGVCSGNVCPASSRGAVDRYRTNRELSTVGIWVGGAVAATGGILLLLAPRQAAGVSVWIGPGSVGLAGRY
jgi:hypothetical protein